MEHIDIISYNIQRSRKAMGYSQKQLADKAGLTPLTIGNIERKVSLPRFSSLLAIAEALHIKVQVLFEPMKSVESVRFRSKKKLKNRDEIIHNSVKWLEDFSCLEELLSDKIRYQFSNITCDSSSSEDVAKWARKILGYTANEPVYDICGHLEDAGIKLKQYPLPNITFFGLSIKSDNLGNGIIVNTNDIIPVERRIFSAVHELGHLLLHQNAFRIECLDEDENEEHEADVFAGYFLLPQEGFDKEWNDSYGYNWIDRVLRVKHVFNVSYKTVLRRLIDMRVADNTIYARFSSGYCEKYGIRLKFKEEPCIANDTEPDGINRFAFMEDRFNRLIREAVEQEKISVSRAADMLGLTISEMRELMLGWNHFQEVVA